jgi:hypothetical protein
LALATKPIGLPYAGVLPRIGEIEIIIPNARYSRIDEVAFVGILNHECQYAEDWIMDHYKEYDDKGLVDNYLEAFVETRAFAKQVIAMINVLQYEFRMGLPEITEKILAITDHASPYVSAVVKEFLKHVVIQEAATLAMPVKNPAKIINKIAQLFIQDIMQPKYDAGLFFKELYRQKGMPDPKG